MANATAPRVKLGNRPKTIDRIVTGPMPDGTEGSMQMQFVYRTRTEFGTLHDERMAAALERQRAESEQREADRAAGKLVDDEALGIKGMQVAQVEANADYLMAIASGWDLAAPFTRDNVMQLCDELPGMAAAAMDAYRAVITEGRPGN